MDVPDMSEELKTYDYTPLNGRRIIVGLTSGAAIYRAIDYIRNLKKMGSEVRVVMTKESTKLIGVELVKWASGSQVYVETTGWVEHIELAKWGDVLVIAPATLRTLARIAYGHTDELLPLLSAAMLGLSKRVIAVPTMNIALYSSPQYKAIESKLKENGVFLIKPLLEEDKAKFPPLEDLTFCTEVLTNRDVDLEGRNLLVTAGATREHIDPVRVITNPSSGLMGVLIAREAACRGANVDLIYGSVSVNLPYNVNKHRVETTMDMAKKVEELTDSKNYDAVVFAAAPVDFTVLSKSLRKIPSRNVKSLTISLTLSVKVAKYVSKRNKPRATIVFAAETVDTYDELIKNALVKLNDYDADVCVANIVGREGVGFSRPYIDACIVKKDGSICYGVVRKEFIARLVVDNIASTALK